MFQTLLLCSTPCLCVNSRMIIRGFKQFEDGQLIGEHRRNENARTLTLSDIVPIAFVEIVDEGIRFQALMSSVNQFFKEQGCKGQRTGKMTAGESCILHDRYFYYFFQDHRATFEILLEEEKSTSDQVTSSNHLMARLNNRALQPEADAITLNEPGVSI